MNSIPIVSTWLLGTIDGITHTQEKIISNQTKYTTLGMTTGIMWLKFMTDFTNPIKNESLKPILTGRITAATLSAPIVIGSAFYLGKLLGKSVKETEMY